MAEIGAILSEEPPITPMSGGRRIPLDLKLWAFRRWSELDAAASGQKGRPLARWRIVLLEMEDKGQHISRSSLYNWRRRYLARGESALADQRHGKPIDRSADPFMQFARRLREQPGGASMTDCHRLATIKAESEGWRTYHVKTTCRFLKACGLGRKGKDRAAVEAASIDIR